MKRADQPRAPAVPPFHLSRRYACDRCRRHKLRCVRDQPTTDTPCQRCRRAREKCTIGASIRPQRERDPPARPSATIPSPTSPAGSHQACESVAYADNLAHDSLHNPDVNWLDTLDLDYDALAGTAALGHDYDADLVPGGMLAMAPTSTQHTTAAAAFAFPSAPHDDFELNLTVEKELPLNLPSNHQRHKNTPPADDASPPSQQVACAHGHTVAPNDADGPASKASSHTPSYNQTSPSNRSTLSAAELKDEAIQELSDLSTSLMKDLHRVVSCKLASSFLLTCPDQSPAEYLFKTLDGSTSQENAIGRMLKGSEKFLEIIQLFNQPTQPAPSFSDNDLGGQILNFNAREEAFGSAQGNSQAQMETRWRTLQSCLERQNPIQTALTSGSFSLPEKPDITSKLAILMCYTCLLRIYETVFFVIHHTLEYSPSLASAIRLPQTVPGLEINGFMLHKHRGLQVKVLIQVSTYMLDSVEKSMHGMLSDPTFQALLKTVQQQEGLACSPGNETGESYPRAHPKPSVR